MIMQQQPTLVVVGLVPQRALRSREEAELWALTRYGRALSGVEFQATSWSLYKRVEASQDPT